MGMAKKRTSSKKWFVKLRGSYIPCNWRGWLTYIPFVGFLVAVLAVAITTQDTLAQVFLVVFPQWIAAAVVMTWVASHKS